MKGNKGSQKGSSTLLVSLFMMTMVVFGLLSLTTSASELKLSRRNAETNKTFYTLDSEGIRFLFNVKILMIEARNKTLEVSDEKMFFPYFKTLLEQNIEGVNSKIILGEAEKQSLTIKRTIALENGGYNKYLNITLSITKPLSESNIHESCSILEWKLWQEPFEYNNSIDLWEGKP